MKDKKRYCAVLGLGGILFSTLLIRHFGVDSYLKYILTWLYGATLFLTVGVGVVSVLASSRTRWRTKIRKLVNTVLSASTVITLVLGTVVWHQYGAEELMRTTFVWGVGSMLMTPFGLRAVNWATNGGKQ